MLQLLRNKAQSIVIQAVVVIIALVFIFFGVGNFNGRGESAIIVGDESISFQQYSTAYENASDNIRRQFGGSLPQGLMESLNIKQQVINQLIDASLLRQGGEKMGIHVSPQEIGDYIGGMPQFQKDGLFDDERYREVLRNNNFSPTTFEEKIRLDMLSGKVRDNISTFASIVTPFEIEDLHRLEKSNFAIRYVPFAPSDYQENISVEDEKLEKWYEEKKENYKTQPEIELRYLSFSFSDMEEKIEVDDAQIEKYYEDHKQEYTTPEQRKARHILFKADQDTPETLREEQLKKAQEVRGMITESTDFAELAKVYSEGPSASEGGDLGFFGRNQMVEPFEKAAFSMEKEEISDIIRTPFGYHIIKLEDIKSSSTKPLSEVRDEIEAKLKEKEAGPMAFQLANEAYEKIITIGSLEAYLSANKEAQIKKLGPFSRETAPEEISGDNAFLDAAFSLKEKELSSLVETSKGYAILFADRVIPPKFLALQDTREKVEKDYREALAVETAKKEAAALLQAARDKKGLEEAAEESGYTVLQSDFFDRANSQAISLPHAVRTVAFSLSKASPLAEEVVEAEDKFYVVEFMAKNPPEAPMTDEEREQYQTTISRLKQQKLLSGWLANQRENTKIEISKRL
ncbi:unnamed protein product [Cyprideis torosa]|uniref:Periplasmic chaperone PpiD n=1 Tax=Cyprideis torosa TaxID=163714 RepID=A0A7R8WLH8_9CRUS|nr:unnamed protein product [Cyprideis torosa]CAG0902504.1 unnamed protein product [Cyprideis torosa]